jgi:hypothetical protein
MQGKTHRLASAKLNEKSPDHIFSDRGFFNFDDEWAEC